MAIGSPAKARAALPATPRAARSCALSTDGAGTLLKYEAKADVGGKLAQLGGRLIDSTARKLAGDFFQKFGAIVGGARPAPRFRPLRLGRKDGFGGCGAGCLAGRPSEEGKPCRPHPRQEGKSRGQECQSPRAGQLSRPPHVRSYEAGGAESPAQNFAGPDGGGDTRSRACPSAREPVSEWSQSAFVGKGRSTRSRSEWCHCARKTKPLRLCKS